MTPFRLHRRSLLRGAAGVAVGLPWLEVMEPLRTACAAATAPKRFLVAYCGVSIAGDSDKDTKGFIPTMTGPNYDLTKSLLPLGVAGAQPYVSVISGLRIGGDGEPGGHNRFHGGIMSALCSGTHNAVLPPAGDSDGVVMGTSSDQIVSDAFASANLKYKDLKLKVQVGSYGNGAYRSFDSISYRFDGGNQAKKLGMSTSPKSSYTSLFNGFSAPMMPGQMPAVEDDFPLRSHKSVVDLAREGGKRLRLRLGAVDKARLDQHLTQIDELGKSIAKAPPKFVATASCAKPDAYGDDPAAGANYGGEEIRAKLMCELMYLAFACDQTRVGTLMFSNAQSFMSMKELTGSGSNLHQLSHFGGSVSSGIAWHMKHFGPFVKRLADTADAGGRMIDNCGMVFLFEGGHEEKKGMPGKFETHSGENYACLVAGKAGGLKAGEHIAATGKPHPANVLISVMNAVGVPTKNLGQISGELSGLRAG